MTQVDNNLQMIALLRKWGFTVQEQSNWQGKNNGITDYNDGAGGYAWLAHHFVCSLDPAKAQGYVDMLINGYATDNSGGFLPGPVVPTAIDSLGIIYWIASGPSNHAGQGNGDVLNRVQQGLPPKGSAVNVYGTGSDDGNKNADYPGTEMLHPGDSTPYPDAMINSMVALFASWCIVYNKNPNTCITHLESTARKDDPSWRGGVDGDPGPEFRRRVTAFIANLSNLGDGMANITQAEFNTLMDGYLAAQTTPSKVSSIMDRIIFNPKFSPKDPDAKRSLSSIINWAWLFNQATWTRASRIEANTQTLLHNDSEMVALEHAEDKPPVT